MKEKRKASGRNIPEAERGTVQVKLRLPPEVAEDLDDIAASWGLTRSGAVARLLEERLERDEPQYCPHDVMIGGAVCDQCSTLTKGQEP